jgi:hypothetical protein
VVKYLNVIFLVLVMAIYAKCLLDRWFKGSIDLYIRSIVIRETFNTREGGQTVWGIDSEGNQVRLYGFGRDTVVPANSNLRGCYLCKVFIR